MITDKFFNFLRVGEEAQQEAGENTNGLPHRLGSSDLFELAGIGLWVFDVCGETVSVNKAIASRLGYSREEMLALPMTAFTGENLLELAKWQMRRRKSGIIESCEAKLLHRDGFEVWVDLSSAPMFDRAGAFFGTACILSDITERKRSEQSLRESEERYRSILENMQDGYFECDMAGRITFCNEAFCRIHGYSQEACYSVGYRDYLTREDARRAYQAFHQVYLTGNPLPSLEIEIINPEGVVRYLDESVSLIRDAQGNAVGFRGIVRDVTERKQTEDALRASEERFAKAFNASPQPMVIFEAPGRRIVSVNEAMVRTFGWTEEEMVGHTPGDLNIWVDMEQQRHVRALLASQGFVRDLEILFRTKAGEVREFLYSAETVSLKYTPHILVVVNDVTERKRAQAALQESEERYRLLFEHGFAGITRVTLDGRILDCNDAAARIYGYELREELQQVECADLYFDNGQRQQLIEELKERGSVRNYERLMKRKDGTPVWTLTNITLLNPATGEEPILEGVLLDITERKLIEQELAQSHEQLRSLSARVEKVREVERTRIAREIHDNLGQALTGLKLDFSWLDKNLSRTTDHTLRGKTASKLKEIAQLLEETIQTVRNIATELRPGVLDTLGLCAAIDWQAREFEHRSGIEGNIRVCQEPRNLPVEEATALFRIFQEILTNIARHSRAKRFKVEVAENGGELTLSVRDDGIGITKEQLRHHKSLGLIGMRERVLAFGGTVQIEGLPGRGTTVKVRMPVSQQSAH